MDRLLTLDQPEGFCNFSLRVAIYRHRGYSPKICSATPTRFTKLSILSSSCWMSLTHSSKFWILWNVYDPCLTSLAQNIGQLGFLLHSFRSHSLDCGHIYWYATLYRRVLLLIVKGRWNFRNVILRSNQIQVPNFADNRHNYRDTHRCKHNTTAGFPTLSCRTSSSIYTDAPIILRYTAK